MSVMFSDMAFEKVQTTMRMLNRIARTMRGNTMTVSQKEQFKKLVRQLTNELAEHQR